MTAKIIENMENINVSTAVIANMFGLSTRRIRQLVEEGIIDRVSDGNYNLEATVKKYILYLKLNSNATAQLAEDEADYKEELAKHERAKRKKTELELALMEGAVHKGEDVEAVMTDMLSRIRSRLLSIPSKTSPMLVMRDEVSYIEDMLEKEINEVLEELSEYEPDIFRGDEYIDLAKKEDVDINGENH